MNYKSLFFLFIVKLSYLVELEEHELGGEGGGRHA